MFLKYYSAIVTEIVTGLITVACLWAFTDCSIGAIIFWLIIAAVAGGMIGWAIADHFVIEEKPKKIGWPADWVQMITLDKKDYGEHPGYIEGRNRK